MNIMAKLSNMKVAVLAAEGFEEVELTKPVDRLKNEGATVEIVSLKPGSIRALDGKEWSIKLDVDKEVSKAEVDDYDALLLPGGVMNPDALRIDEDAVSFVKDFVNSGKPVAVICHGPQTMIDAGVVKGKKMTSYPAIKNDLKNAGADWVDEEVVVDGNLVSSRSPEDLPAFQDKMVQVFAKA